MNSDYPVHDYGPLMRGMISGGLGIVHVFLAQMAIGGGMLLCYFERLRQRGRSKYAGRFITGYYQDLVLVSFMLGALIGVTMWFVAIWVHPRMIGILVDEFHWIWATEWTFFCVQLVAGCAYVRYSERMSGRDRLILLAFYSVASWFSLFWINGILSSQLAPGRWMPAHSLWSGFFNPSFWPLLVYRTVAAMAIAALGACVVINISGPTEREARRDLMGHALRFLAPMVLMPFLGAWFWASLPADSRSWVSGGSLAVTMFIGIALVASLVIGACGLRAFWYGKLEISRLATAVFCVLAFSATAGCELVCEFIREPFSIRQALFAGSHRPDAPAKERR